MNQRPPSGWDRVLKHTMHQTHRARAESLARMTDEQLHRLGMDLGFMLRQQLKACASTHEALGDVMDAALSRHVRVTVTDDA